MFFGRAYGTSLVLIGAMRPKCLHLLGPLRLVPLIGHQSPRTRFPRACADAAALSFRQIVGTHARALDAEPAGRLDRR